MDKFMSLSQLAMSIFMLLGTIAWGITHTIMGTIGLMGILVVLFFAYLMWFSKPSPATALSEKNASVTNAQ